MSLFTPQEVRSFSGDPLYNPFERPSMPLESLALDGILGAGPRNDSGEQVDPLKGMAIPTAYRCIAILSTVVASCPLEILKPDNSTTPWDEICNLVSVPSFEFFETMVAHLGGWGNYYAKIVTVNGKLVDLVPIFPGDVNVKRIKGQKTYVIRQSAYDGDTTTPGSSTQSIEIPESANKIFHVPFLGYDGLQGLSPILLAAQTMGTALAADRLAARFYSRGQQLGGILKIKAALAEQDQADAIKASWRRSHQGIRNAGDVAVLDAETDFQPITIDPVALQFLESRQWQASEIAKMFGLPPFMISEQTTWGTGIEQQWQGFIAMTLRSYTDRIEQRASRQFFSRGSRRVEFNLNRLMRGSTMERYQAYGQAIGWGWMTRAEVRAAENKPEIEGLDEPLQPAAMNGALADGPMNTPPSPNLQDPNQQQQPGAGQQKPPQKPGAKK